MNENKQQERALDISISRFKVKEVNCDGWVVPPPVEEALKELCKKHNELVGYLATDI